LLLQVTVAWIAPVAAREVQPWNAGWRFHLGDCSNPHDARSDAEGWRKADVPHDWSVELPFDAQSTAAGGGGFFQNGIGWYRRSFAAPNAWAGQDVTLEFDGVYRDAEVWLNGISLGRHPYGYTPFRVALSPHLRLGAENLLAVRVDNSAQPNSRWYAGSGIYRHVRLVVTAAVAVAPDGVFVRTNRITATSATVGIATVVRNRTDRPVSASVETIIRGPAGRAEVSGRSEVDLGVAAEIEVPVSLEVSEPQLWTPESPTLYRVTTRVLVNGRVTDEVSTPFGIRTVSVSAERGFLLNGRAVKLLGGNVHHDHGILGAVALDRAEERKVVQLKTAGFNAVRTAHNPPSSGFLDACDRLGLLVLDEAFDGWEKKKNAHDHGVAFTEWAERDVAAWVNRDRNHPSVVMWSIGNEVFERAAQSGPRIAEKLAAKVRAVDPTRPVTIGLNGLGGQGDWTKLDPMFGAVDVAGYNYELARHVADHARLPQRVIVATESYQSELVTNWRVLQDTPYVIGDFVWSALDYLGEAGLGRVFDPGEKVVKPWEGNMWPWKGAPCGEIDLTGERKPASHYRNIVWDRGEKLYAAVLVPPPATGAWGLTNWSSPPRSARWTWPGWEGAELTVEVYSRHESVRLYLNGKRLGEKPTTREQDFTAAFAVPYAPGELRAVGVDGGRETERFTLQTAGTPVRLRATLDRSRLRADGGDLAFVVIEAVDQNGIVNPECRVPVRLSLEGPATLAGFGNADLTTGEAYRDNPHRLAAGRALAAVRSTQASGRIRVTVDAPGMVPTNLNLETAR
jgi:beta-galactosidase